MAKGEILRQVKGTGNWLLSAVDITNYWVGKTASLLVLLMVATVSVSVFFRFCLNNPLIGPHEVLMQSFSIYVFLSGGYVLLLKSHIIVDVVYGKWSPRKRAVFDLGTSLLSLLFMGIVVWYGWENAVRSVLMREVEIGCWKIPCYHVKVIMAIGVTLFLAQVIVTFIRNIPVATRGKL